MRRAVMAFASSLALPILAAIAGCSDADGALAIDADAEAPADDAALGPDAPRVDAGALGDGARVPGCPDLTARVATDGGSVCVDLYEGALVVRLADGGETPWPYYEPVDGHDGGALRAVPARGIAPQGYISAVQAAAACESSGKRLCTYDEWVSACRGLPDQDNTYPYGDTYEPGACNEGKESPIVRLFGPTPTYSNAELNDPRCDQLDGGLARGGDYPRCVSAYGAFDMHGNLHEWVDDTPVPSDPSRGSFLGGYFVDARINGAGCGYRTTAHAKTYHDYSTGFRCCSDPG
jgi:sulfatase modifying factor 1